MLKSLKAMLTKKEEERAALVAQSEKSEDVIELRGIHTQLEKINQEIEELRGMVTTAEAAEPPGKNEEEPDERTKAVNGDNKKEERAFQPGKGFEKRGGAQFDLSEQRAAQQEYEKRGKALKENRAVTVAAGGVILPKHQASDIKPTFNQVSSLVDLANWKPLLGGESYQQPYVKTYGEGDYTDEGDLPKDTDPTFGYAEIQKTKITAYAEVTEELEKLPAAPYAMEVEKSIRIALRKKIAAEIMIGDGTTKHLTGILHSATIQNDTDLAISAIDEQTLDEIIFSYGGDEDVEDAAVLILNKKDLKAFSKLRTKDGKKFHTIVSHGNTGTMDGIPYVINSRCKAISAPGTAEGDFCMAYGSLSEYDIAEFSPIEIKKSTEYKFKEGFTAYRGAIMLGGNVVAHNGFLRIKKGAAVAPTSLMTENGNAVSAADGDKMSDPAAGSEGTPDPAAAKSGKNK